MSDCLFCREAFQAQKLWEDEYFYVVADRSPVNPGHLLSISKAHRADWFALTSEEKADLSAVVEQMRQLSTDERVLAGYRATLAEPDLDGRTRDLNENAVALWERLLLGAAGYNLGCNCGVAAGQSQMHFHYHLIPRLEDDCALAYGGVRQCIHERGDYRSAAKRVAQT